MLIRVRFRSMKPRTLVCVGICILAAFFLVSMPALLKAAQSDDSDSVATPSPMDDEPLRVAEEMDIFKERAREQAKRERQENRFKKKKVKAPPTVSNMFKMTATAPNDVTDGLGLISRAGYLAGKTLGRQTGIAPVEAMPYILTDEHFFFADVRGFVNNYSLFGGNGGLGYRYIREDFNAWGGASVWYDADQTSTKLFQQVGVSFEALVQRFELRSNLYFPTSSNQVLSNTISNAQVVGNQLLYGRSINTGTGLQGVDGEFGYSLPIQERHFIRAFVGGYHFQGSGSTDVNGVKARIEAVYNNGPMAHLLYTNDRVYGSNLMAGFSFQFPFGNNHPTSGWKQPAPSPFRFVERNYNVIVGHQVNDMGNQVATDPNTGNPYVVEQVYSPPPGGTAPSGTPDGTSAHPFSTIAAAQGAGGDIIVVQSGSVLNESVTMKAGEHLIGAGTYSESLPIAGGGSIQIPSLIAASQQNGSTQSPLFTNVTGTAITLANNTEVSGFTFSGTTGNGITGDNVSNVSIHDVTFLSTGADAIHLTNSSGNVNLFDIQITNAGGDGIVLDGGTANITYKGSGDTITSAGDGFVLSNLTGGVVNISNLSVKNTGGIGLNMDTVGTNVIIDSFTATGTTGAAVAITGTTGFVSVVNGVSTNNYNTFDFTGPTSILSPKAAGFTVNGSDAIINVQGLTVTSTASAPAVSLLNDATSAITFSNLVVNTNNAKGLFAVGLNNLTIDNGSITTLNAGAVDIQSSAINTTFAQISADGGPFGISLAQSTGVFTVSGNGHAGSGGTIENTSTGLLINTMGTTNINMMNFTSNATAIQSTASNQLNLTGVVITGSTSYAIDSLDDALLNLNNSTLSGNGAIGAGTIRIRGDVAGTFSSMITSNNIADANGTAIQYATTSTGSGASLSTLIQSNTIVGTRGNSPIISVNWAGPAQVAVENNQIEAFSSFMTAMLIKDTSATDSLTVLASGNSVLFEPGATSGTGISVVAANTSQFQITQNTIDFQATGGTGLRFALTGASNGFIGYNTITDQSGGATGMLFDSVGASSTLEIDGNTINLLSTDLTTHQGIIFTTVSPTIQFSGSVNNQIFNASTVNTLFSIPVNSATGGFFINGQLVN